MFAIKRFLSRSLSRSPLAILPSMHTRWLGFVVCVFLFTPNAARADSRPMDATCRDVRTEVLPVLGYPRKGEAVTEHREITLQILSLIPCSSPSRAGLEKIKGLIDAGVTQGRGVQEVVEDLRTHFQSAGDAPPTPTGSLSTGSTSQNTPPQSATRRVFALVSEFYDNLSVALFEIVPGRSPVYIKLTMKRDGWTRALEELRPRFEDAGSSFFSAWDRTGERRSVRVVMERSDDGTPEGGTLERLRSELGATLTSRFRNPLPPKLWERRSFFRLADGKETPDAFLDVRVEREGTRVFARVIARDASGKARSIWLEGSIASLPEFENRVYESGRDMLMELAGIFDYGLTVGPEFLLGGRTSVVPSLSLRHNRGNLAATMRIRAGRVHWPDTCGDRPLLVDFGILPGWQFVQTERVSLDAGIELSAGFTDIAFAPKGGCQGKPRVTTHISAGYGTYAQAAVSTYERLSLLGRVSYGGLSVLPTGDKDDDEVRSRRVLGLTLGAGLAL